MVVEAWMVYALWEKRGTKYGITWGMVGACENSSPIDCIFSEKLEVKSLTKREDGEETLEVIIEESMKGCR